MNRTPPVPALRGNRLLARLSDADQQRLRPHLQPVTLERDTVLYEMRGRIDFVYFPTGSVLSALTIMRNGRAIEVGTIGNEGAAGLALLAGSQTSPNRTIAQIAGGGQRIAADVLHKLAEHDGPLRRLLLAYHALFFTTVSQSVACNGLHSIQERCCRWLLMTHDRVEGDEFRLTHEYLAFMLGTRRAGVTEVLQSLRDEGWITYNRGRLVVLDRGGLEAGSCECYRAVNEEYERLFP
jgi:CRP-like cAMP-binding protein